MHFSYIHFNTHLNLAQVSLTAINEICLGEKGVSQVYIFKKIFSHYIYRNIHFKNRSYTFLQKYGQVNLQGLKDRRFAVIYSIKYW